MINEEASSPSQSHPASDPDSVAAPIPPAPTPTPTLTFATGGTVKRDNFYVERQADSELLAACREGRFVYVLAPRQIGKSSLMARSIRLLRAEGLLCAKVDLTQIGGQQKNLVAEQWYFGILYGVSRELRLDLDLEEWWTGAGRSHLSYTQRLVNFFVEVVLTERATERVVVFVDEIDTTLSLDFTDDFFAAIRSFYDSRETQLALERLSFVLLGVATPADLIRDPRRTPFNIGQRVEIGDFTYRELASGVAGGGLGGLDERQRPAVLHELLAWTGGQPFLTMQLLDAVNRDTTTHWSRAALERLVKTRLLETPVEQDSHLALVADRLTRFVPTGLESAPAEERRQYRVELLTTYLKTLRAKTSTVPDNKESEVVNHLKLSGAVAAANGFLRPRNRLYSTIFGEKWVLEQLPPDELERRAYDRRRARRRILFLVGGVAVILATLFAGLLGLFVWGAASRESELKGQRDSANQARATAEARQEQTEEEKLDALNAIATIANMRGKDSKTLNNTSLSILIAYQAHNQLATNPARALLLSLQSNHYASTLQASNSLREVLTASPLIPNKLEGHSASVNSVAFSPDGKTLASSSADNTVILWEVSSGKQLQTLKGHSGSVNSVAFSPDGKTLASASDDSTIILWEAGSWKQLQTLKGHSDHVISVAFSPDGKTLASASGDKTIILWEVSSGKPLQTLRGHSKYVISVAFSPDGKTLASSSADNTVILWEVSSGKPLQTLRGHSGYVNTVAFSPDGKTLASASVDSLIILWEVSSGKQLQTLRGDSSYVNSVEFSPDGKTLAAATWLPSSNIILWEVGSWKQLQTLKGQSEGVHNVAFSPDSKTLASASDDKTIILWKMGSDKPLQTLKGHSANVNSVAFSPDGKTLASASFDNTVILWEVSSGKQLQTLKGHSNYVISVAFSPDGRTLASSSFDNTIILWEVSSGKQLQTLKGHSNFVLNVVFSPDGKTLASSSTDKTIILWEVSSGKQLQTLRGHSGPVADVVFNPDGRTLASSSSDKTIMLWEVSSGKQLQTIKGYSVSIHGIAFNPDGKTLAWTSVDNTIILSEIDQTELEEIGCSRLIRNLTWAEWQLYVGGDEPYEKTCPQYDLPSDLPDAEKVRLSAQAQLTVTPNPTPTVGSIRNETTLE